ncbi:MAG: hypothetical protein J6Z34_04210 [Clostridia bacterium]|nr:hypothetical protein [Clostridia bacterium]
MKELIRKTAFTALAAAAGAILLGTAVFMLFFPSAVSEGAYRMGMYKVSATFARNAYEKYGGTDSLKILVERAIIAGKHDLTADYAPVFINDAEFDKICGEEDGKNKDERVGRYRYYVTGNLAVAQYLCGQRERSLETVVIHTVKYERFNALEYLLKAVIDAGDKTFASALLSEMEGFSFEGEEAELLEKDKNILRAFIG